MDFESRLTEEMSRALSQKIENVFIEGLKLKGFEFDNRMEMENFIKTRCRCEDYKHRSERIYYVYDIPFLLHKYGIDFNLDWSQTEKQTRITATAGEYKFL